MAPPAGPVTSKRQRTSQSMGPTPGPSNPVLAAMDSVEDEEDTSRGDVLDHIPPREISTQRYKQHHEWFEEVFTSPYGSSNIEPGSIGIEMLGSWLKPMTEGILDKNGKPLEGKTYKEAVRFMTERSEKRLADIDAEIEQMIREHKAMLEEHKKKSDRIFELFKELRYAEITDDQREFGLVLPDPIDSADINQTDRTIDEICAEFEEITGGKIIGQDLVFAHNPQEEVIAHEEARKALMKERAAAAAAAELAKSLGLYEPEKEEDKMAGVGPSESTSPDDARYLVPVVIEKTDVTGSSTTPQGTGAQQPPASTAAAAAPDDTPMTDAEPLGATTSTSLPAIPVQAATGLAGTPALSGTPMSPFIIPSPSPAGFTPQTQSRNATPGLPTPLPQTADPGASQTPNPLQQGSVVSPAKQAEEPPTVPGEDDLLEGITGGDGDFFGGGDAAEAMDLLGAEESFADQFM
ncbi:hypothetical protein ABW20_dc0101849 [Dactylellina cionopaga]|nr:hypothetical protein ABW20_dc0101849 [Dactylellina cionopaga]